MISWKTLDTKDPSNEVEGHPLKNIESYVRLSCEQEQFTNELYYFINEFKRYSLFRLVQNNLTGMTFIVSQNENLTEQQVLNTVKVFNSKFLAKRTVLS